MKIKNKLIIMILVITLTIISLSNITLATTINDLNAAADPIFKSPGNQIITVISAIGMVVSVVVLIFLGIKYMLGSVEEKAEYKKTLFPYLIGAGLVFAGSTIAQIVYNIAIDL